MKKLLCVVLVLAMLFALSSCLMSDYSELNGVHVSTGDGEHICVFFTEESSCDDGFMFKTDKYGSFYASTGTFIMFKDTCPICGKAPSAVRGK